MKKTTLWITLCMLFSTVVVAFAAQSNVKSFDGTILLGRPTDTTMTINLTANSDQDLYVVWGERLNTYTGKSAVVKASNLKPAVITMTGLKSDQLYHYKVFFKAVNSKVYSPTVDFTFQMPRQVNKAYSFVVQSDSHLLNKADRAIYAASMKSMANMKPDFMMDLGDTFLNDQIQSNATAKAETIRKTTFEQRAFMDTVTKQAPLFLVIGNHEGEYGNFLNGTANNMAAMSTLARKTYFPNPEPNAFYSGNGQKEPVVGLPQDYYAFQWGDALYVTLDPYRYTTEDPYKIGEGWNWTLGKTQYDWFKKTLESSKAKYKFVFAHHAIGNIRGGAEVAKLYEWGGYDKNGQYLFDQKRPGWGKPIQQLMKDNGVTIFFQGHDHLFAREVVDGVVYQTLPKPAERIPDAQSNYDAYPKADVLMNSGFLKVDVTSAAVKVDYYRNYFVSTGSQKNNTGIVYSYTVDAKHKVTVLKTTKDDLKTYGSPTSTADPKATKDNKGNKDKKDNLPVGQDPNTKDPNKKAPAAADIQADPMTSKGSVILGYPTQTSISLKMTPKEAATYYVTYHVVGSADNLKTAEQETTAGTPLEVLLTDLKSDEAYQYQVMAKAKGENDYKVLWEGSFRTAKPVSKAFTFTVQADSHRDENSDYALYSQTLKNVLQEAPDFHFDLGDTFMGDKLTKTKDQLQLRYLQDRGYFETLGAQVPIFLVNGNHEGENGWERTKSSDNVALWASQFRQFYFPNKPQGEFYTGSQPGNGNYYSFTWGDAQFIALDPFWFSESKAQSDTDGWDYTLGDQQYQWLKTTLANSQAKHKFVFIHNLVGGYGKDARGGAEASSFFEWGGSNPDGTYAFDTMRPGWGKPIHQLLVDAKVDVVFHGHDHFYAKQERDGIIYQLVPQPSHPGDSVNSAKDYSYINGLFLPASGHIKVQVDAESVKVEYIYSSTKVEENGVVKDHYEIK